MSLRRSSRLVCIGSTRTVVTQEVRKFATTYDALFTLSTWLTEQRCPVVALESTGVYWRPVYHVLLEGTCYEEARYDRLQSRQEERQQKRAVKALERLGYRVTLERLAQRRGASQLILHTPLAAPLESPTRVQAQSCVSVM